MKRMFRQLGPMSYLYFYPLMDDFMTGYVMERPKMFRLWTWDDSSKIVDFMTLHLALAEKYGLNIPVT